MEFSKDAEITHLLERLEDILEEGKTTFLSSKVAVDRDEVLDCIKDIRLKLPTELQQSVWIVEERNKILAEAQHEGQLILKEAQDTLQKMIDQHEITKYAEDRAQYILDVARKDAKSLQMGSLEHAEENIKQVEQRLKETVEIIHKEVKHFEDFASEIVRTLYDERMELKQLISNQMGNQISNQMTGIE